ncbi:MAG: DUF2877 domain-containing protein [Hyphomicrobiaceae bacterium]|nr:DUF2877 domain-containing protein [Hyphomicrobiaceae bacterium]
MNSIPDRFHFSSRLAGGVVSTVLEDAQQGRVAAVFRSTFYVDTPAGLFCVGNEALTPSPLNLVTAAPVRTDWRASGVRRGTAVRVSAGDIKIGGCFSFCYSNAARWTPAPLPRSWTTMDLERGLQAFRRQVRICVPEDGFGRFLVSGTVTCGGSTLTDAARYSVSGARAWIAAAIAGGKKSAGDCVWVRSLSGFGPGLTPSGDDFIGGAMIALRALGEHEICDRIWSETQRQSDIRSNPISYAHLRAASDGEGCAAIHDFLNHVVTGQTSRVADSLADVTGIGHSSGWDVVVGMEAVLDGRLRADRR